jgi:hypothetical protein
MSDLTAGHIKWGAGKSRILLEISGTLDRKGFESLKLDINNVVKKHGLKVEKFELKKATTKKATKK